MTMIFFVKITVKLALLPFYAVLIEEIEDSKHLRILQFQSKILHLTIKK